MSYSDLLNPATTPQSEPLPGVPMVRNGAGGYTFELDDWGRLDRFLILGSEAPTYYATARTLTRENAACVARCLAADGTRTVARIAEISASGRAPRNEPAILALAMALKKGDDATRRAARAAVPAVCRTGTHLLHLAEYVQLFGGWGRGTRRAFADWFQRDIGDVAYQLAKYQSRDGWSMRDLLRLSHPRPGDVARSALFHWVTSGLGGGEEAEAKLALLPDVIRGFEAAKAATSAEQVVRAVIQHRLPRECVPSRWLTHPAVWSALLENMPLGALVRNLATMTRVGLLAPLSAATGEVVRRLSDGPALQRARLHPVAVLSALRTYQSGHGVRGGGSWTPVQTVCDALDAAFYTTFGDAPSTGGGVLLALDVSGSMATGEIAGVPGLTPREASCAMALVTAAREPQHLLVGFTSSGSWSDPSWRRNTGITQLPIGPRMRLLDATRAVDSLPFGATDCALPMLFATANRLQVDTFVVYTDNETWHGAVHPIAALREYRQRSGRAARLVVVGMTATQFTIADPADGGMLDVVGFDAAAPALIADFGRGAR